MNVVLIVICLTLSNSAIIDAISLKKVELYTQFNAEEHKTSYFESVQEQGDLIVRRGKAFYIQFALNQNYDFNAQQFWLQFVFGSKPKTEDKSLGNLRIRANSEFMKQLTDWDINMYNGNGSALNTQVFMPATVPIGMWKIRFIVIENGQRKTYEIKNDVYVLFNPWVKEDDVYMPNNAALEEYVLNDVGKVYLGTANSRDSREWLYGQYKLSVLPAIMYLINLAPLEPVHRSNAMQLTSVLSALVNSNDDDGLLYGKWSEPYKPFKAPWEWMGSAAILEQYYKTNGTSVRYGQCWVFAAVLTTICRALGIPARPVTNYRSAHDTNQNLMIERYYEKNGATISGLTADSIWNFHVWTEAWMSRTDLPPGYNGWQVVDATPQELSEGYFRTGPAPVAAIKEGKVDSYYDSPFVYAEVNADLVDFYKDPTTGEMLKAKPITNYVGSLVITKRIGLYYNDIMHPYNDEDITNNYKFQEGTYNERSSFYNGSKLLGIDVPTPDKWFTRSAQQPKVDISIVSETDNDTLLGEPFTVKYDIKNNAQIEHTVEVFLNITSTYYTARHGKPVTLVKKTMKIPAKESKIFSYTVKPEDYLTKLLELSLLKITTFFKIPLSDTMLHDVRSFHITNPPLDLSVNGHVAVEVPFQLRVHFTNPLQIKLSDCKLTFEGKSYGPLSVKIEDIESNAELNYAQSIKLERPGTENFLVNLHCDQLFNILGKIDVNVAYD